MIKQLLFAVGMLMFLTTDAQNVGIGTSSPGALLDVSATNAGVLIPRVALTDTGSAGPLTSPATSTMVYNTATATNVTPGYYYWSGTAWIRLIDNASIGGATTVSNTSSANTLSTTVNGVTGTGVNIINTNALSLTGNNLTTTINGIGSSAQSLSGLSLSGDVTGTLAASTVGRIQGTPVTISSLSNGNLLQYNSSGTDWVNVAPGSALFTAGTGLGWSGSTLNNTGVTSVATGSGLTGGPITTTGTIGIAASGITNAMLANSSITVTAGAGMSGGGAVSLGGSITLTNAGVTSAVAGTGIGVSSATGAVTFTNTGVTSIIAGSGISISGGAGAVTLTNSAQPAANTITGSGTTNYHAKFTSANTIGNSLIFDNGTNVGIGTAIPSQPLEIIGNTLCHGIHYQKTSDGQGSGAHGISWYDPSFTTWFNYMAPAGGTNAPSGTAAPSDATSGVTSWALRSNIENIGNYGWIFESGVNGTGNAPTVKFSINSGNGTFHATGNANVDGVVTAGANAVMGTGIAGGYYQDVTNGAYRSIVSSATTNGYYFQTNAGATTTMYVGLGGTYNGNVGIGTLSPGYPLDVSGNIRSTPLAGSGYRQVYANPSGVLVTGLSNAVVYNYNGADQSYTVPAGVTSISVKMWGGGGGGGYYGGWTSGFSGGGGGYTQGVIAVTPGQVLTVMVGAGGTGGNVANMAYSYGGGSRSCNTGSDCRYGGQGGGRSAIRVSGVDILTAGGGGGGGASRNASLASYGGAGGGLVGQDGTNDQYNYGHGMGGSQVAGGSGSTAVTSNGTAGTQYTGGNPGNNAYGGGGGGGWYGGGGGGYAEQNTMAGGGGGSGYISGAGVSNAFTLQGTLMLPPKMDDISYVAGKGLGGFTQTTSTPLTGGNGMVVIYF